MNERERPRRSAVPAAVLLAALLAPAAARSAEAPRPGAGFDLAEMSLLWMMDDRPAFPCHEDGVCATDPELKVLDVQRTVFLKEPAAGTLRVACVGDSTTAGWPYHPRGGYPQWMAAALPDLLPGVKTEVLNLGVHAWDGPRLERVFDEALSFGPSVIVLRVGYNDPNHVLLRHPPGVLGRLRLSAFVWLTRRSALFRRAMRGLSGRPSPDPKALFVHPADLDERALDELTAAHRARLERLVARARSAGVAVVLLGAPFWDGFGRETWNGRYLPRLASATEETARDLGVPFAPLSEVRGAERFVDSIHPDLEGYRLTALGALRALEAAGFGGKGARWRWGRLASPEVYRRRLGLDDPDYKAHLEVRLALFFLRHRYHDIAARHMESAVLGAPNPDLVPSAVGTARDPDLTGLYREVFSRLHAKGKAVPPRQVQNFEVLGPGILR